uniref:Uncharacterized protein n=1 Tax=Anguilla anguilla TaxID=7936 RepID=A0A0E9Q8V4_ANGAN
MMEFEMGCGFFLLDFIENIYYGCEL